MYNGSREEGEGANAERGLGRTAGRRAEHRFRDAIFVAVPTPCTTLGMNAEADRGEMREYALFSPLLKCNSYSASRDVSQRKKNGVLYTGARLFPIFWDQDLSYLQLVLKFQTDAGVLRL